MKFDLHSQFSPKGDQPKAIKELVDGLNGKQKNQVLLGVTGSGKTFTMANVINQTNKPTLIISHNKTLAAQLYGELKNFFPNIKENFNLLNIVTNINNNFLVKKKSPTIVKRSFVDNVDEGEPRSGKDERETGEDPEMTNQSAQQ